MKKGVFSAKKQDGTVYFRTAISKRGKRISLGSFDTEDEAASAYSFAVMIYENPDISILSLPLSDCPLSFEKSVTLINHRDNGIYIKTPIYLRKGYFSYFISGYGELKFDNDDLFYYSSHRILIHNGHLYVNDFGMQYGILARYGIKNYAVPGRDYRFANGDDKDFRYANIIVINRYHGVRRTEKKGLVFYEAKLHIKGEYIIGRYESEAEAAAAYNKAADLAEACGIKKKYPRNYIVEYSESEYHTAYQTAPISENLEKFLRSISDQLGQVALCEAEL